MSTNVFRKISSEEIASGKFHIVNQLHLGLNNNTLTTHNALENSVGVKAMDKCLG